MDTYAPDSEVVIGLVTPVGVNYDDIRSRFETYFDRYQYKSNWLHLSKLFGLLLRLKA
jgi:hypothetical protein